MAGAIEIVRGGIDWGKIMIQLYQGSCGEGKTTKLLELCGAEGIFIVFCDQEKQRIRKLSRSTRCFTILELINGKTFGIYGDFYFDNLDLCLSVILGKPYMFGIKAKEMPLEGTSARQANDIFFVDSDKWQRILAAVDYATTKNFYIISPSDAESDSLMHEKQLGTHYPITYKEFLSKTYHPQGIKGFYLHEAHIFLSHLTRGQNIAAATVTP